MDDLNVKLNMTSIKRDCSDLRKVTSQIQDTFSPFSSSADISTNMFNLSTGEAVTEAMKSCLLGAMIKGKVKHDELSVLALQI